MKVSIEKMNASLSKIGVVCNTLDKAHSYKDAKGKTEFTELLGILILESNLFIISDSTSRFMSACIDGTLDISHGFSFLLLNSTGRLICDDIDIEDSEIYIERGDITILILQNDYCKKSDVTAEMLTAIEESTIKSTESKSTGVTETLPKSSGTIESKSLFKF